MEGRITYSQNRPVHFVQAEEAPGLYFALRLAAVLVIPPDPQIYSVGVAVCLEYEIAQL
ncbi:MAG: hypothetical protein MZV63_61460 [Marinilabiliales bacterium]|nr:hypothetical protein [Marinilabiliales bacterium]